MYIVKANATDRDENSVNVYIANAQNAEPFTLSQRDAARYSREDANANSGNGFRIVKLVPRSRS